MDPESHTTVVVRDSLKEMNPNPNWRPHTTVVVRDSFKELVTENPYSNLLLCVHEAIQPPELQKIAAVVGALKIPKLVVGRIDVDQNDLDFRDVGGIGSTPLLRLFPREPPEEGQAEEEESTGRKKTRTIEPLSYESEACIIELDLNNIILLGMMSLTLGP